MMYPMMIGNMVEDIYELLVDEETGKGMMIELISFDIRYDGVRAAPRGNELHRRGLFQPAPLVGPAGPSRQPCLLCPAGRDSGRRDLASKGGALMIRLVYVLRRLPNLSRQEFQTYWQDTHGPLVAKHSTVMRVRRYVQTHTLDDPINDLLQAPRGTAEPYDGVAELWWNHENEVVEGVGSPEGLKAAEEASRG